MIYSMTGYGAGFSDLKTGTINVEIKTVNGRYCDIQTNIPREYMALESDALKLIKSKVSRGRIKVNVTFESEETKNNTVLSSEKICSIIDDLKEIAIESGIEPIGTLDTVINAHYLISKVKAVPEIVDIKVPFNKVLKQALENLIESRAKEGKALLTDILKRIKRIDACRKKIYKLAPNVVKEFQERINKRLDNLNKNSDIEFDPVRVLTEIGLFSERVDVTEELVRMKSHLDLFNSTIDKGGVVGKKLDFVLQELFRETNTIGSKSGNSDISALVVSIKEELEKIREQIQNIE